MLENVLRSRVWLHAALSLALAAATACGDDLNFGGTEPDDPSDSGDPSGFNCSVKGNFADAKAHFVNADTIAFPGDSTGTQFELAFADCQLRVSGGAVEDSQGVATTLALTEDAGGLAGDIVDRFPHLSDYRSLSLSASADQVREILKGQFVLVEKDDSGSILSTTRVQIPGALDALYSYSGDLGVTFAGTTPSFRLWAPTARSVKVRVYDSGSKDELAAVDMTESNGVWSVTGEDAWYGHYYLYEVVVFIPRLGEYAVNLVTDPYSVGLSTNSNHSLIVDLADPATMPGGWDTLSKPALEAFEDISLYELHIRDFSASDKTVPGAHRGRFMAFTHDGNDGRSLSDGMRHLQGLAAAGLSHVHLLPAFDIATVEEDAKKRVELDSRFDDLCAAYPGVPEAECAAYSGLTIRQVLERRRPDQGDPNDGMFGASADIQRIASYMYELDGFNWGYDPYHYTTPEGSYATDPEGVTRIREFRSMVQALNQNGLRVVMDVVYNHTHASGQNHASVLDRIVPGYYHRLNQFTGEVERSTCCDNTATENAMMNKLMVDSLVTWAKHYKVDGFRFDLMGHHMKDNMADAQAALQSLTVASDGVEGSEIYLYGEGWNFGEVVNNTRGVNATQLNMGGTGIATFSDRLRDGVRGGGPFDGGNSLRDRQGFATGMCYDPNRSLTGEELAGQCAELRDWTDMIRIGMAGNLADFVINGKDDIPSAGDEVSYYGGPAGYTQDPQEVITYISAHDNQTLWDNNQYKLPRGTSMDDRVRVQNVGTSVVVLGQGIPFIHAGAEILRSKSFTRDSYNSGDWFNVLDFTYESNNWNVGLPRWDKDGNPDAGGAWDVIKSILSDPSIDPRREHIEAAAAHFRELLRIRKDTRLLRLRSKDEVTSRVDFHNTGASQVPGLIVQTISDGTCAGGDLDPDYDAVAVLINANDQAQSFSLPGASGFELHPIHLDSQDEDAVVKTASFAGDTFNIPARTAAVFVQPQSGAQGAGVACNTRGRLDVYLRGTVTTWDDPPPPEAKLVRDGVTQYSVTVTLDPRTYQFKIASPGWAPYNWGINGGSVTPDGAAQTLVSNESNISIDIADAGAYKFIVDFADFGNPTVRVERVLPSLEVYLRGSLNNWVEPPPAEAQFIQDGGNEDIYSVRATLDIGAHEFKIASPGWSPYDWGNPGGPGTITDDGVAQTLAFQGGNITFDVTVAGTFIFTLDVGDIDNPTIKVERQLLTSDVFVRGSMSSPEWDALPEQQLMQDPTDTDRYTVTIPLGAMTYQFKVADASWSTYNWGNDAANITPGDPAVPMTYGAGNMRVAPEAAGDYVFILDTSNLNNPTIAVEAAP